MSKVYSFRLDENIPREAQARDVIDAWVDEGYSLRQKIVDMLISLQDQDKGIKENGYDGLLKQIESLIAASDKKADVFDSLKDELSGKFISSLKASMRGDLKQN